MNVNEMKTLSKRMSKIAEDFDFGKNEIISIHCEHLPGFDDCSVRLSADYPLDVLAVELNEIVDEISSRNDTLTRRYFVHKGVEYFQLIGN